MLADIAGGNGNDHVIGTHIDSLGRVLMAGVSAAGGGAFDMFVGRLTDAGVLDATFGTTGLLHSHGLVTGGTFDIGQDVWTDELDNVVVLGGSADPSGVSSPALWRFTADGVADTCLGASGTLVFDATRRSVTRALRDGRGRIVAIGSSTTAATEDMLMYRFER